MRAVQVCACQTTAFGREAAGPSLDTGDLGPAAAQK
jgi:hypothetical protein